MSSTPPEPMTFSVNPRLDFALRLGWENWERAAARAGESALSAWLTARLKEPALVDEVAASLSALFEEGDAEERALLRGEIAELLDETDDELADTLWEGVLAFGRDTNDADHLFEATRHLAAIAERFGDPLAAAEYFIEFLNWRRDDEHASDTEPVEEAFEETIRLAERDGEPRAAAIYSHRQATYHRFVDADDDRATTGDWEGDRSPFLSWA